MSGEDHSESCDNPHHAHWDGPERRSRPPMTEEELKKLAQAVAENTVKEVFKQMSLYTGRAILGKLWWVFGALVFFLALKFGIVKLP